MELKECKERWVDVFLTNPTTESYDFDDKFCCSIQSVEFDPGEADAIAYVTENDSDWILPTWSKEYDTPAAAMSEYANIKVGDLVRIGNMSVDAFTNYLTVIETKVITHVANATSEALRVAVDGGIVIGDTLLSKPTSTSTVDYVVGGVSLFKKQLAQNGIAHIAIRVNASLNATKLNTSVLSRNIPHQTLRQTQIASNVQLANRNQAYHYHSNCKSAFPLEATPTEKHYYPLYRHANWNREALRVKLDHGVKQVLAVKLMGYSLINKRHVGIQHAHELQTDDYVILRVKEIEGHVVSNNRHVHGSFAVLQSGTTSDNNTGATEYSRYEPGGIICVPNEPTNTIRNLTIEVKDRLGNDAHFGRFHLWFKLLTTHG